MKKTKKLIVPIALLVLAVMATTSTTFAWFTTNSQVNATTSKINVSSNEDMLYVVPLAYSTLEDDPVGTTEAAITNSTNWKTSIADVIEDLPPTEALAMTDVTLKQGTFVRQDLTSPAAVNTDYLEITYTFWCSREDANLYFITGSTLTKEASALTMRYGDTEKDYFASLDTIRDDITTPEEEAIFDEVLKFYGTDGATASTPGAIANYAEDAWYTFNGMGTYKADAINAARVLFDAEIVNASIPTQTKTLWNPGAGKGYDAAYTGALTAGWSSKFDVQELYRIVQTGDYGTGIGLPIASYDPYSNTAITDTTTPTLEYIYNGVDVLASGTKQKIASFAASGETANRGNVPYYRADVTISMWLEGWDSDCFNVILGQILGTDFSFTTDNT